VAAVYSPVTHPVSPISDLVLLLQVRCKHAAHGAASGFRGLLTSSHCAPVPGHTTTFPSSTQSARGGREFTDPWCPPPSPPRLPGRRQHCNRQEGSVVAIRAHSGFCPYHVRTEAWCVVAGPAARGFFLTVSLRLISHYFHTFQGVRTHARDPGFRLRSIHRIFFLAPCSCCSLHSAHEEWPLQQLTRVARLVVISVRP
jgi:hypothetical protein